MRGESQNAELMQSCAKRRLNCCRFIILLLRGKCAADAYLLSYLALISVRMFTNSKPLVKCYKLLFIPKFRANYQPINYAAIK